VDSDLPCVGCGYNLRGLAADGRCPECALPVERSRLGDRLDVSNVRWLRTTHRGLSLVQWGGAAMLASVAAVWVWSAGGLLLSLRGSARVTLPMMILRASAILGALLLVAGVICLTRPEPRTSATEPSLSRRRTLCGGLWAWVTVFLSMGVAVLLERDGRILPQTLARFSAFAADVLVVGLLLLGVFVFRLLEPLAGRIPSRPLMHASNWQWRFMLLLAGAMVLVELGGLVAPAGPRGAFSRPIQAAETLLKAAVVLNGVKALVLAGRMRESVGRCLDSAAVVDAGCAEPARGAKRG
jgi:hypothetical protein